MRLKVNGKITTIPSSLSEITLGQRIAFQDEHGDYLTEWLNKIIEMEDGLDKQIEISEFELEQVFRSVSFFTGIQIDVLKESSFVDEIYSIYHATVKVLFESEDQVESQTEYVWNGEIWHLSPPELKQGDSMTFGELIDSKQIVKNMSDLGKSKWHAMLNLCAIYLRKKDEAYDKAFLYEGSERLKLMESLPMDIAMGVGFFLSSSMNLFKNHFLSFTPAEQRAEVAARLNTSSVGDGLTS